MDKNTLINYIESSFIKDIISDNDVTDISYNGRDIFYVNNMKGNIKSEIKITQIEAKDFTRNIANISEKQFNFLHPILDVNIGRYRINAVYNSIGRVVEDECITFAIRIASLTPKITSNHKFMLEEVEELFNALLLSHYSIVICGVPGVGKTEFQKYLLSLINQDERIIIIDNTIELSFIQRDGSRDITLWQADEYNEEANISSLIKNGLRNNPDWMIVSEARGKEMNDVLVSAVTGVPIITTIHSLDAFNAPVRMAKAIMLSDKKIDYQDTLNNIYEHFKIFVHLKKYKNSKNNIVRYISSIVEVNSDGSKNEIYHDDLKKKKFAKLSRNLSISLLNNSKQSALKRFIGHE